MHTGMTIKKGEGGEQSAAQALINPSSAQFAQFLPYFRAYVV